MLLPTAIALKRDHVSIKRRNFSTAIEAASCRLVPNGSIQHRSHLHVRASIILIHLVSYTVRSPSIGNEQQTFYSAKHVSRLQAWPNPTILMISRSSSIKINGARSSLATHILHGADPRSSSAAIPHASRVGTNVERIQEFCRMFRGLYCPVATGLGHLRDLHSNVPSKQLKLSSQPVRQSLPSWPPIVCVKLLMRLWFHMLSSVFQLDYYVQCLSSISFAILPSHKDLVHAEYKCLSV